MQVAPIQRNFTLDIPIVPPPFAYRLQARSYQQSAFRLWGSRRFPKRFHSQCQKLLLLPWPFRLTKGAQAGIKVTKYDLFVLFCRVLVSFRGKQLQINQNAKCVCYAWHRVGNVKHMRELVDLKLPYINCIRYLSINFIFRLWSHP